MFCCCCGCFIHFLFIRVGFRDAKWFHWIFALIVCERAYARARASARCLIQLLLPIIYRISRQSQYHRCEQYGNEKKQQQQHIGAKPDPKHFICLLEIILLKSSSFSNVCIPVETMGRAAIFLSTSCEPFHTAFPERCVRVSYECACERVNVIKRNSNGDGLIINRIKQRTTIIVKSNENKIQLKSVHHKTETIAEHWDVLPVFSPLCRYIYICSTRFVFSFIVCVDVDVIRSLSYRKRGKGWGQAGRVRSLFLCKYSTSPSFFKPINQSTYSTIRLLVFAIKQYIHI